MYTLVYEFFVLDIIHTAVLLYYCMEDNEQHIYQLTMHHYVVSVSSVGAP